MKNSGSDKKEKRVEFNEEKEFEERIFPIEPTISLEFLNNEHQCKCGGACKNDKHEGKECSHHTTKHKN